MSEIYLYHGTDQNCAEQILKEGFSFHKNPEHWLGNGIYFFEDKSLASWWTTRPSQKFGTKINKRVLIESKVEYDDEDVLNLKNLEEYEFFCSQFSDYLKEFGHNGAMGVLPIQKMRCAYCDFFQSRYNYKMIIGTFYKPEQSYLPKGYFDFLNKIELPYIEVQYCIFSRDIIVASKIIEI